MSEVCARARACVCVCVCVCVRVCVDVCGRASMLSSVSILLVVSCLPALLFTGLRGQTHTAIQPSASNACDFYAHLGLRFALLTYNNMLIRYTVRK